MRNVTRSAQCLFGGTILSAGLAAPASAQLFNIDQNPGGWAAAKAGLILEGCSDFTKDASYPLIGIKGPVTSAGNGPVSPGTVYATHSFNTVNAANYFYNIATLGPHYGFGNPHNALLANYFVDAFRMDFSGAGVQAVEFNALTVVGGASVNITVYDSNGSTAYNNVNVGGAFGANLGVLGNGITRIDIFDAGGGAEGVQRKVCTYLVPAPSSAALLALGGLVATRRRR
ncbi:MAG: hypothetical protein AMXMBFR77_18850 [Phycisphaerales bacterium]|nr:PEP-CTERM sorting domain-containing protein [Phycisphaerales bacterium]GIK19490.1 MAG: hypothetical protein BroJett004_16540 [Planctomycetota bacterium]